MIAFPNGLGADVLSVTAGMSFSKTERRSFFSSRHRREKPLLEGVITKILDRESDHQVGVDDARDRHPAAAKLFDDSGVGYDAKTQAEYEKNFKIMMDSCGRFLDHGAIEVTYTSEYYLG